MAASGKPLNREFRHACGQCSFSRGEKAGMRAGVVLDFIFPAWEWGRQYFAIPEARWQERTSQRGPMIGTSPYQPMFRRKFHHANPVHPA
jgi:hypothetical protein